MRTKKLAALAMLTAMSLVIFMIEAQLPPLAPIPGIKLGLANIVTLITMAKLGRREAFLVLILRILLGSVFAGQMMSLMYSLCGGLLCFCVTALLIGPGLPIWVVSVFGAIAHNTGQVAVAVAVTRLGQITAFLPLLLVSAIVTGAFTGCIAAAVIKNKSIWRGIDEN
ncbi:MAG: Gx transporter family protein [Clostridia bacterium]|nr:Gx transporter family protein [Clostridia bacterium]